MKREQLHERYQDLRSELDAAYAAPVWDSGRISEIADELVPVELALALLRGDGAQDSP